MARGTEIKNATADPSSLVPMERMDQRILLIRGHRVIIAADLAELYGVPTKAALKGRGGLLS
jgi:hypothetical protein